MREPRVTVVIPTFNNAETIGASIHSALGQSERDLEILVVDDGSHDETYAIVKMIADCDPRVQLIRHPVNLGAAAARNTALKAARGQWVALLDADDRYEPGRIARLLKVGMEKDADIVCDELQLLVFNCIN